MHRKNSQILIIIHIVDRLQEHRVYQRSVSLLLFHKFQTVLNVFSLYDFPVWIGLLHIFLNTDIVFRKSHLKHILKGISDTCYHGVAGTYVGIAIKKSVLICQLIIYIHTGRHIYFSALKHLPCVFVLRNRDKFKAKTTFLFNKAYCIRIYPLIFTGCLIHILNRVAVRITYHTNRLSALNELILLPCSSGQNINRSSIVYHIQNRFHERLL